MLFDSHCHLDSFKKIEMPSNITAVTSGHSHESNIKNLEISSSYEKVYCSLGIAPQTAIISKETSSRLDEWINFIRKSQPSAVGEVGLDFHWAKHDEQKDLQRKVFREFIYLAEETNLPMVIHSRDAESEVLEILSQESFSKGIMMHCFSGKLAEAKKALDMGALISIPPMKSKERKKTIKYSPIDNLLLETDAPYIGKTLSDVRQSAEMVSEIKGIPLQKVEEITYENAAGFFQIK